MATTPIEPRKSNVLVITLVSVGGVLLLVVVALTFLLIGRGLGGGTDAAASPSPQVTTTTSPSPTPSENQPVAEPVDTSPRFTSFNAQTEVQCPNEGDKAGDHGHLGDRQRCGSLVHLEQ